jgi:hypothetical protein
METTVKKSEVKKSDFVLTSYMKSNNWRATYQILNTVIPYFSLWVYSSESICYITLVAPAHYGFDYAIFFALLFFNA